MVKIIENRKFTDVICALIFIGYTVFSAYMIIYGWSKGNLDNLAQPYDADGFKCGKDDYLDYEYVFVNEPLSTNVVESAICVKKCPTDETTSLECMPTTQYASCSDLTPYESKGFLSRICLPTDQDMLSNVMDFIKLDNYTEIM